MPPRPKGPRLYLRDARRDATGRVTHPATWIIRDGPKQQGTGCGPDDAGAAEQRLAEYIARKHVAQTAEAGERRASEVQIADVVALYARDVAGTHSRPKETAGRLKALLGFFGTKTLSQINRGLCRDYAEHRGSAAAARRDLEDLRAAINHFHAEGHVREIVKVPLPERSPARDRWLTRQEAAQLLRTAWRMRERQLDAETGRYVRRHVARFILVGLYAGRRAGAIVEAALQPEEGRGFIDLKTGVFYPKQRLRKTKKRQPPIILPRRLLAHLRRWKKNGARYVVEWNGAPITRMAKAFRATVKAAGLGPDVTPHILRHTAATWMMQRGADPWAASGYLGMSLETLIQVYGHHHPDHQKSAWSVFDRPGGEVKPRHRNATGRRERKKNKPAISRKKTRKRR